MMRDPDCKLSLQHEEKKSIRPFEIIASQGKPTILTLKLIVSIK